MKLPEKTWISRTRELWQLTGAAVHLAAGAARLLPQPQPLAPALRAADMG